MSKLGNERVSIAGREKRRSNKAARRLSVR
jgi:hypothetical protein